MVEDPSIGSMPAPTFAVDVQPGMAVVSNDLVTVEVTFSPLSYSIMNPRSGERVLDGCAFEFITDPDDKDTETRNPTIGMHEFTFRHHETRGSLLPDDPGGASAWFFLEAPRRGCATWLAFGLVEGSAAVLVQATLVNQLARPLRVSRLVPLCPAAGGGFTTAFDGRFDDLQVYCNGYQSWSLARAFSTREKPFHPAVMIGQYPHGYRYLRLGEWLRRPRGEAWSSSVAVITDPASKVSMTIGFLSALAQHGEIVTRASRKNRVVSRIEARSWSDGKRVRPGGELASELLYIQHENRYPRCLDEYAMLTAKCMQPVFWDKVPFGYCTWYYYYHRIDEAETLKNLHLVTDPGKNPHFTVDYFQLDDGYQPTRGQCGDWTRVNQEKFPSGLKHLVQEIKKKGLVPGLWIAPFNAMPGSDLAIAHPDWILKNRKGKPITATFISGKFQHALDPTHPGVKQHLKELFRYLIHEIGFTYIKIDFVFTSITQDAVFHDGDASRVEAYRDALGIMREAAGEKVFILGCGAPVLESVGLVNGMRVSADTAPKWSIFDKILMKVNQITIGMKYALLNTITRSWMHKQWWINDPDCLLLRTDRSKLTEHEIRTELAVIGLSGGQVAISEDLTRLEGDRMALVSLVQPVYEEPARSPDMFERRFPGLYMLAGSSPVHGTWKAVTAINWKDRRAGLAVALQAIGCDPSATYHVVDFWEERYIGTFAGDETLHFPKVPKHGCKLLRVTRDDDGAVLLGSTFHVVQGAVEVDRFSLDHDAKVLRVLIAKHGSHRGSLWVKLPHRCLIAEQQGEGFQVKDVSETVYRIDMHVDGTRDLAIKVDLA